MHVKLHLVGMVKGINPTYFKRERWLTIVEWICWALEQYCIHIPNMCHIQSQVKLEQPSHFSQIQHLHVVLDIIWNQSYKRKLLFPKICIRFNCQELLSIPFYTPLGTLSHYMLKQQLAALVCPRYTRHSSPCKWHPAHNPSSVALVANSCDE